MARKKLCAQVLKTVPELVPELARSRVVLPQRSRRQAAAEAVAAPSPGSSGYLLSSPSPAPVVGKAAAIIIDAVSDGAATLSAATRAVRATFCLTAALPCWVAARRCLEPSTRASTCRIASARKTLVYLAAARQNAGACSAYSDNRPHPWPLQSYPT